MYKLELKTDLEYLSSNSETSIRQLGLYLNPDAIHRQWPRVWSHKRKTWAAKAPLRGQFIKRYCEQGRQKLSSVTILLLTEEKVKHLRAA